MCRKLPPVEFISVVIVLVRCRMDAQGTVRTVFRMRLFEESIFAKDFGLVCFVSAISSVEFGSMKEKPIIPNSYGRFIKRHYADDKAKYKYNVQK